MSVSSVGSVSIVPPAPSVGKAADGDSWPAAAESAVAKQAERSNGGFAPRSTPPNRKLDKQTSCSRSGSEILKAKGRSGLFV
jgi:hypothetical protein